MIFLGFGALGTAAHVIRPLRLGDSGIIRPIGALLAAMALGLASWARASMHAAGTNVRPSQPSLAIVAEGPYKLTRNPMYLSLCILLLGIGLMADEAAFVLLAPPLAATLHFGVILREERYLTRKFGGTYLQYKLRVRRWI